MKNSTPEISLKRSLGIAVGGAPPSLTIIAQMERTGANVHHVYGLTEVYGPFTICAWQPAWDRLPADEQAAIRSRQGVAFAVSQFLGNRLNVSANKKLNKMA